MPSRLLTPMIRQLELHAQRVHDLAELIRNTEAEDRVPVSVLGIAIPHSLRRRLVTRQRARWDERAKTTPVVDPTLVNPRHRTKLSVPGSFQHALVLNRLHPTDDPPSVLREYEESATAVVAAAARLARSDPRLTSNVLVLGEHRMESFEDASLVVAEHFDSLTPDDLDRLADWCGELARQANLLPESANETALERAATRLDGMGHRQYRDLLHAELDRDLSEIDRCVSDICNDAARGPRSGSLADTSLNAAALGVHHDTSQAFHGRMEANTQQWVVFSGAATTIAPTGSIALYYNAAAILLTLGLNRVAHMAQNPRTARFVSKSWRQLVEAADEQRVAERHLDGKMEWMRRLLTSADLGASEAWTEIGVTEPMLERLRSVVTEAHARHAERLIGRLGTTDPRISAEVDLNYISELDPSAASVRRVVTDLTAIHEAVCLIDLRVKEESIRADAGLPAYGPIARQSRRVRQPERPTPTQVPFHAPGRDATTNRHDEPTPSPPVRSLEGPELHGPTGR